MNVRAWQAAALAAVIAVGVLFFAFLGDMPLTDRDEGEYAAAVAAMERNGDYLIPTLNGRRYLEKPILVFWAMAATQALAPGEAGARLPSALSAFLLVLITGALAWRTAGSLSLGVLTAAALAFGPLMALTGRACLTDQLLTLFTTAGLALFFMAHETEPPGDRWWWLGAWLALGLGFLTKGPVALAVVLPTALIYAAWQGSLWQTLKRARLHWGLLILIAVNLPWYGLAFLRLGGEFWRSFFVAQNLNRFSEVLLGHGGGWLYYPPVLLLGFFPFLAPAVPALARALFKNPAAARRADASARLRLLAGIASLVTLAAFTLAATKQINYILPALPFLAILAGYFLWRLAAGEEPGKAARWTFWGLLGLGCLAWTLALVSIPAGLEIFWDKILASIRPDSSEYALPAKAPFMLFWPLVCAAASAAIMALPVFLKKRGQGKWMGLALAGTGAVFCGLLTMGLMSQTADIIQQPAKTMALEVKDRAARAEVITYGLWKPSLFYYLDRDLERVRVPEKERLTQALAQPGPVLVLTRLSLGPELEQVAGFRRLRAYGGYLLGGNQAAFDAWSGGKAAKDGGA